MTMLSRGGHLRTVRLLGFLVVLVAPTFAAAQTPTGNNAARANSYDDAWQDGPSGWVANARAILAGDFSGPTVITSGGKKLGVR